MAIWRQKPKLSLQTLKFGHDLWDPSHRFETSWLLPPWVLFGVRALIVHFPSLSLKLLLTPYSHFMRLQSSSFELDGQEQTTMVIASAMSGILSLTSLVCHFCQ